MKAMIIKRTSASLAVKMLLLVAVVTALWALGGCSSPKTTQPSSTPQPQETSAPVPADTGAVEAQLTEEGDLLIAKSELSGTPVFYSYQAEDTPLEILAVVASDDTVRVAFNTCQICYNSGRGYYLFQNGSLVCQNCGNRFGVDQIAVEQGGCNPVPIVGDIKTEDDDTVVISAAFLAEAAAIFENWKA